MDRYILYKRKKKNVGMYIINIWHIIIIYNILNKIGILCLVSSDIYCIFYLIVKYSETFFDYNLLGSALFSAKLQPLYNCRYNDACFFTFR